MEPLILEPTPHSPRIHFDVNGKLLIEGRAIPENVTQLFKPLEEFILNLDVPEVTLDINMDYFNTATSKKLLELLKHLDANNKIKSALINWHYESDDEDSLDIAEIYEECLLRAEFRYIEHAQQVSLFEQNISA